MRLRDMVEPTDETLRAREARTPGPRELLAKWFAFAKAFTVLFFGGIILWGTIFGAYGVIVQAGYIKPDAFGPFVIVVLILVAVAKLYGAWVLPIRY